MMNSKLYQSIYDELAAFLPATWEKLVVYLEYGEDSYSFSFYVKFKGKYVKCYDLPNVSENQLFDAFSRIDKFVSKERKKCGKDLWSNMTMTIGADGNMHADINYTDLSEGFFQYKKTWKAKFLC